MLLPAGADSCAGPVGAPTGPFQPRDVAFSPDGSQMVLTTRRAADPASPEMLAVLDIASGQLTPITSALPGRQKEPSWQQTVDLAVTAPPSTPTLPVNASVDLTVTVTNRGPAPALGTTLTLTVPPGLRLDGLRPDLGTCDPTVPRCDLGVLAPGQSVGVTATVTGTAPGAQRLTWSVTSATQDSQPADNTADTVIPVETILASPALAVTVAPAPGYVGGAVAVTYTARNGTGTTATGLRLDITTPAQVPVGAVTPGCAATGCALPDLPPGARQDGAGRAPAERRGPDHGVRRAARPPGRTRTRRTTPAPRRCGCSSRRSWRCRRSASRASSPPCGAPTSRPGRR